MKNVEEYSRFSQATVDNIIRRMRFVCWITKATNTYTECAGLILIAYTFTYTTAFECYTYKCIACLV